MKNKFKSLLKRINFKGICLEVIAIIIIINGLKRFYMAFHSEEYMALANYDLDKLDAMYDNGYFQFYLNQAYWMIGFTLFTILLVGLLNWKNNLKFINSFLNFIIISAISFTGFFVKGPLNRFFDYCCKLLSEKFAVGYFVGGLLLCLTGLYTLWFNIHHCKTSEK